jgi:hypothetical protein
MAQGVFKVLKDLGLKAVGLDEKSQTAQEGYFMAFRSIGLRILMLVRQGPGLRLG